MRFLRNCTLFAHQARNSSTQSGRRRVVVTGSGAVTPLANNGPDSWQRILADSNAHKPPIIVAPTVLMLD